MIKKSENMEYNMEEKESWLSIFEGERFDRWTDTLITGLTVFLTIVGIPFTIYVLWQFLFSLK